MQRTYLNVGWILMGWALFFGAGCDLPDPGEGPDPNGSDTIEDTDSSVTCEAELQVCLASCDNSCWGPEEKMPAPAGDQPTMPSNGCVDSCQADYIDCVNQPPKTCETKLDQCLGMCPVYATESSEPAYDQGGADCIDQCFAQYNQCVGGGGECWSDHDCQPGFHCEFQFDDVAHPGTGEDADQMAPAGVCVPDDQPNDCDKQLDQCLAECDAVWNCGPSSNGSGDDCAEMPYDCEGFCWKEYDRCLNINNGECRSNEDCQPGFHCELYDYGCPEGADCMPPDLFGQCEPDGNPNPCEKQLDECLMQCPMWDCACDPELDGCDCAEPDNPCVDDCYLAYDVCLGGNGGYCWSDDDCAPNEFCAIMDSEPPCGDPATDDCYPERPMGVCVPGTVDPCQEIYDDCLAQCPMTNDCYPQQDADNCLPDDCFMKCDSLYRECLGGYLPD